MNKAKKRLDMSDTKFSTHHWLSFKIIDFILIIFLIWWLLFSWFFNWIDLKTKLFSELFLFDERIHWNFLNLVLESRVKDMIILTIIMKRCLLNEYVFLFHRSKALSFSTCFHFKSSTWKDFLKNLKHKVINFFFKKRMKGKILILLVGQLYWFIINLEKNHFCFLFFFFKNKSKTIYIFLREMGLFQ